MTYRPHLPVTSSNCPTRDALEKKPKTWESIGGVTKARNARQKRLNRIANLAARAEENRDGRK